MEVIVTQHPLSISQHLTQIIHNLLIPEGSLECFVALLDQLGTLALLFLIDPPKYGL
jgi:hypothetical protein